VAGLGRAVRRTPHPRLLADDPGRAAPGDDQPGARPGPGAVAAQPCLYPQTSVAGRPERPQRRWRHPSGTTRPWRRPEACHAGSFRRRHAPGSAPDRADAGFRFAWRVRLSAAQAAPGRRACVPARSRTACSHARVRRAGTGVACAAVPGSAPARAAKRPQAYASASSRGDCRIRNGRQRPAPALGLGERPGQSGGRSRQTDDASGQRERGGYCVRKPAAPACPGVRSGCAVHAADSCRCDASVAVSG